MLGKLELPGIHTFEIKNGGQNFSITGTDHEDGNSQHTHRFANERELCVALAVLLASEELHEAGVFREDLEDVDEDDEEFNEFENMYNTLQSSQLSRFLL